MGKSCLDIEKIVVVEDTNILIDLANTGLLALSHNLGIFFYTTDMVIHELTDSEQLSQVIQLIDDGKLKVIEAHGHELINISLTYHQLTRTCNLSLPDVSVMLLAERLQCRLLTADIRLKKQALSRGIACNGLLWLTDLLVEKNIVLPYEMVGYLQTLLDTNNRAPYEEIISRIDKYLKG